MTVSSAKPSDYVIAVSTAVLLHGVMLVAFMISMVFVISSEASRKKRLPKVPVVRVEIRPEYFSRVEKKLEVVPEAVRKRFARTAESQASAVAPENAKLIGERDTRAASELPPDPDGPEMPSQTGRKPKTPGEMNTFTSDFQEGEEPGPPRLEPQPAKLPTPEEVPEPAEEEVKGVAGEDREDRIGGPKEKFLQTDNQVPVPEREGEGDMRDKEMRPKESRAKNPTEEPTEEGGSGDKLQPPVEEQPKEPGFRSEVTKTRLRGSLRRRGKSSLDVENSPLGRYQAKLSRAVENEWQKNCVQYRDHITPGLLTIRFLVDARGKVSGFRFLDSVETGEIQKGFTLKSIQNAAIPAMPREVSKDLGGEPLELVYNFFF